MIDILATMTPDEYRRVIATLTEEGYGNRFDRVPWTQNAEVITRAEEILHTLRGTESRPS